MPIFVRDKTLASCSEKVKRLSCSNTSNHSDFSFQLTQAYPTLSCSHWKLNNFLLMALIWSHLFQVYQCQFRVTPLWPVFFLVLYWHKEDQNQTPVSLWCVEPVLASCSSSYKEPMAYSRVAGCRRFACLFFWIYLSLVFA